MRKIKDSLTVDETARSSISVSGMVDRANSEVLGSFDLKIVGISFVQDTISEEGTGTDGEEGSLNLLMIYLNQSSYLQVAVRHHRRSKDQVPSCPSHRPWFP